MSPDRSQTYILFNQMSFRDINTNWMEITFNFRSLNPNAYFDFSQCDKNYTKDNTSCMVNMDQSIEQRNSNKKTGNVHMKTYSGEKLNKCNQCDFTSSRADNLRRHMKIHSGEKSNKCNQGEFASSRADNLRRHLKTHSGEKSNANATCVIMHPLRQVIWGGIWKPTVEKSRTSASSVIMHPLGQAL